MSNWLRTSLGKIASFKAGNGFPKKHQGMPSGELPFAKVSDMNSGGNELYLRTAENYISRETAKTLKAYVHQPGSTAFAKIGVALTTNRRRLLDREVVLDNNMMSAAPKTDSVDPRFFYYLLSTIDFNEISAGSALPYLTASNLKEIEVSVPEIPDQREIATLLGALDDKIELNRRMSATLEEMARALYRSWFVDFDPVHARALGQPPAHMDATTAALFPDSFGPDGLPKGWEKRPLGHLIEDTIGGDWGKEAADEKNDTPISIIRGTDFPGLFDGGQAGVPTRFTTKKKADRRSLQPFDIVLEVSGGSPKQPTGRTLLITQAELDRFPELLVPASFCRRLRPTSKAEGLVGYLHAQQLYLDGGTWGYQNQSTGISNFQTPRFLDDEMVVNPGEEVLTAFRSIAEPMLVRARTNENMALTALRDTLLPRLMSGELRIREAEKQVEEVG